MHTDFLIADTHFSHSNILNFKRRDGSPLRCFDSVEHMNETMVERWNRDVRPNDKVYHIGDVSMGKRGIELLSRLNGVKILIKGNHDQEKMSVYMQYFKDVRAYHQLDKFFLSHIPIHPGSMGRWKGNVHGHLHADRVMLNGGIDVRYFNVSVEQIDYTPISLDELNQRFALQAAAGRV